MVTSFFFSLPSRHDIKNKGKDGNMGREEGKKRSIGIVFGVRAGKENHGTMG